MLRSIYSGIAGMRENQLWFDVISGNMANVNTPGYKKSRISFEDLLSQTLEGAMQPIGELGGTNPMQVGLGASVSLIQVIHTQGTVKETEVATDLLINGEGYFVVSDGSTVNKFTRAGSLGFDPNGNLINLANGFKVLGWNAERDSTTGQLVIDANNKTKINTGSSLTGIKINSNDIMSPKATTKLIFEGNINSSTKTAFDSIPLNLVKNIKSVVPVSKGGLGITLINSWDTAGFENTPTGTVTIGPEGFTQTFSLGSKPQDLVDAINNNSATTGISIEYTQEDKFVLKTDPNNTRVKQVGGRIVVSETHASGMTGFFTEAKIPVQIYSPSVDMKINFEHLLDPTDPSNYYVRWKAVDSSTNNTISTNAYYYITDDYGISPGQVTGEEIGYSDGTTTVFELDNPDVDPTTLQLYIVDPDTGEKIPYQQYKLPERDGTLQIGYAVPDNAYYFDDNGQTKTIYPWTWDGATAYKGGQATDIGKSKNGVDRIIFIRHSVETTTWAASTAYKVGDMVIPSAPNGLYYRCTTAGTSDSVAPSWKVTVGEATTDGTVVWTTYSYEGPPKAGSKITADYVRNGFNLNLSTIDPTTLQIKVAGAPMDKSAYTFNNNLGRGGNDQITFFSTTSTEEVVANSLDVSKPFNRAGFNSTTNLVMPTSALESTITIAWGSGTDTDKMWTSAKLQTYGSVADFLAAVTAGVNGKRGTDLINFTYDSVSDKFKLKNSEAVYMWQDDIEGFLTHAKFLKSEGKIAPVTVEELQNAGYIANANPESREEVVINSLNLDKIFTKAGFNSGFRDAELPPPPTPREVIFTWGPASMTTPYTWSSGDLSNYSSVNNFINAVNNAVDAATGRSMGITMRYDSNNDRFTIVNTDSTIKVRQTTLDGFLTKAKLLTTGMDSVSVPVSPTGGGKITSANYNYNKTVEAKGILQLDSNYKVINNFKDTESVPEITSSIEVIDGPESVNLAGNWSQFDGGTVNGTMTIKTDSGTYSSKEINISNYPTVQSLLNEINASDAKVLIEYDPTTDKFTIKSRTEGARISLSATGTIPFFSEMNITLGSVEGGNNNGVMDLKTERPTPVDGWSDTTSSAGTGKDFMRINVASNEVKAELLGSAGLGKAGTQVMKEPLDGPARWYISSTAIGASTSLPSPYTAISGWVLPLAADPNFPDNVDRDTISVYWATNATDPNPTRIPDSQIIFSDNTGGTGDEVFIKDTAPTPTNSDFIYIRYETLDNDPLPQFFLPSTPNVGEWELSLPHGDVDKNTIVVYYTNPASLTPDRPIMLPRERVTFKDNTGNAGEDQIIISQKTGDTDLQNMFIYIDYTRLNAFDLKNPDIDSTTLVLKVNNVIQDASNFTFKDGAGANGVERIILDRSFGTGKVEVDYRQVAPLSADVFIPNGNSGAENITFTPNTGVDTTYLGYKASDVGSASTTRINSDYILSTQKSIYDALGKAWDVTYKFERLSTNRWLWSALNPSDTEKYGGYGILAFDSNGDYDKENSKVFESPSDEKTSGTKFKGLLFDPEGKDKGASPVELISDFTKLHQFSRTGGASSSDANIASQDGYGTGKLKNKTINTKGVIVGEYTNDQVQELGQISVASFINTSGLLKEASTLFVETLNSGAAKIGTPGSDGRGLIESRRLEMANVDLVQEFTDLIIAQRAFQANSRIIVTDDQILTEIVNMKR